MGHNYKKLKVWEKAIDFVDNIYEYCQVLPSDEKYNLQSQLRSFGIEFIPKLKEQISELQNMLYAFRNSLKSYYLCLNKS